MVPPSAYMSGLLGIRGRSKLSKVFKVSRAGSITNNLAKNELKPFNVASFSQVFVELS